jgi:hypothetical protein
MFVPHLRNSHRLSRDAHLATQHIDRPLPVSPTPPSSRKKAKIERHDSDHENRSHVHLEYVTKLLTHHRNPPRLSRNARLAIHHIDSPMRSSSGRKTTSQRQNKKDDSEQQQRHLGLGSFRNAMSLPSLNQLWHHKVVLSDRHEESNPHGLQHDGEKNQSIRDICQDTVIFHNHAMELLSQLEASMLALVPLNEGLVLARTHGGECLVAHHASGSHSFQILDKSCMVQHSSSVSGSMRYALRIEKEFVQWIAMDNENVTLEERLLADWKHQNLKGIPSITQQ